jgi:NADH-quinone oxidoreductase subunit G
MKSNNIDLANRSMGGGEVVAQVGIASGSNLKEMASTDAIIVVASDLHQEAPVWWMRVKQAADRGASLVILNARPTRLDKFASHVIRYQPGQALAALRQLVSLAQVETESVDNHQFAIAADLLVNARNLVAFYGAEGLTLGETDALARLLGNLLQIKPALGEAEGDGKGHVGHKNNGLIPVWPANNTQGAWDMGIHPRLAPGYASASRAGLDAAMIYAGVADGHVKALYVMGADPVGDGLMPDRGQLEFLVVQELFLTETAAQADVVLPAQSWAEREGTFTSGERRVQRYYPGIPPLGNGRPDWQILAQIGERFGSGKPAFSASLAFSEIAQAVSQYRGMDYRSLAHTEPQWPNVGVDDLYYGGNAYENRSGLGQQWPTSAESAPVSRFEVGEIGSADIDGLALVGATTLYAPGTLIRKSALLAGRLTTPAVSLHEMDAIHLQVNDGEEVTLRVDGWSQTVLARVEDDAVAGLALLRGANCPPGTSVAELSRLEEVGKELA